MSKYQLLSEGNVSLAVFIRKNSTVTELNAAQGGRDSSNEGLSGGKTAEVIRKVTENN